MTAVRDVIRGVIDFHGVLDREHADTRHSRGVPAQVVRDVLHFLRTEENRQLCVLTYIGVHSLSRREGTRLEVAKVNRILAGVGIGPDQLLRFQICDRREDKGRFCAHHKAHFFVDDGGDCIKSAVRHAPVTRKFLVTNRFGEHVVTGFGGEVTAISSLRQALLQVSSLNLTADRPEPDWERLEKP